MSNRMPLDKQQHCAETFIEFINHFLSRGAPPNKIKEMLSYMVDEVYKDRKSLT
jgi:hypothetical protein